MIFWFKCFNFNFLVIRRKSAVERLAESKYNYIKCSPVDNGLTEKHKFIHKSLSTGKTPLLIASQTSTQTPPLLPINQNTKCDQSLSSSILCSTQAVTRKRNSSLSSRLSEGSNNLELQLRQLINDDIDSEVTLKRESTNKATEALNSNDFTNSNTILRQNISNERNNIETKKHNCILRSSSSHNCKQIEPSTLKSLPVNSSRQLSISRSKSDVSNRLLMRRNKSKDEIERFFETLGLDSSVWDSIKSEATNSMISTPPHYFDSCESFNSGQRRINMTSSSPSSSTHSNNAISNEKLKNQLNTRLVTSRSCHALSVGTSIVEKNARVIKWLYNCRKAMLQH